MMFEQDGICHDKCMAYIYMWRAKRHDSCVYWSIAGALDL